MKKRTLVLIFALFTTLCFAAQDVDVISLEKSHITTVVTVSTTTATALPATALLGRRVISIQNIDSSAIIYLGNADVTADETATGGYQLANQYDTFTGDFSDDIIIYGIASSSAKCVVWEAR